MERNYNIPLRKEFSKVPRYKKSSKSIRAIKEFIIKHMKVDEVVIGKYLNQEVWKNGPKNPPSKVSVKAVKEDNKVKVELIGAPEEPVKEEPQKKKVKEEVKEEIEEELETSMDKKTAEKVAEEVVEQTKEITKDIPKEKIPTAKDLAEKKETKVKKAKAKKVPTTKELKNKKTTS
jgi:large subunit ribosomal protein L31e